MTLLDSSHNAVKYDFLVVGAGIVGLTTALEIRKRYPHEDICVLEGEQTLGVHASGRNSGVLHSGIYYSPGTLKAKVCSDGSRRMKQFALENGIKVADTGKLIVAVNETEVPVLDRLMSNAQASRIEARKLGPAEILAIEPHVSALAGIHVPSTSVIDGNGVLGVLRLKLEEQHITIHFGQRVSGIDARTRTVFCGENRYQYGILFNCAGAHADRLAKMMGLADDFVLVPFKGIYYKIRQDRNHIVRASVYPVPDLSVPFLGVHFTRVANGDVYVGPTAIPALGRENYGILGGLHVTEAGNILWELGKLYVRNGVSFRRMVHSELSKYWKRSFLKAAQRLIPEVKGDDLMPTSKVGIRPQLVNSRLGKLEMDFVVEKSPTSIHVLNAISPAFTGAFAFSEYVVDQASL